MAHFYGVLQGGRGRSTRCGTKSSDLRTVAASWHGAVEVVLTHDEQTGADKYEVRMIPWRGSGESALLASGIVGKVAP